MPWSGWSQVSDGSLHFLSGSAVSSQATLNFLRNNPVLRRCSAPDVERSARLWRLQPIDKGDILWVQGMPSQELGIVVQGDLQVDVNGAEVGMVRSGELVGEVATFFGQERSASLRAHTRTQVLTLGIDGLRTLRREDSPVYRALLDQALLSVVRRVRATNLRIAMEATGDHQPPGRKNAGAFARMWKKLRPGAPKAPCPPIEPLLKKQPGLSRLDDASLQKLGALWTPVPIEEGRVVVLEGDESDTAYLIATGEVAVLRNVRGDRAEKLCSLHAGDQFGSNTLVEKGTRTASCVMASAGWLYTIHTRDFQKPPEEIARVWKESVLRTLTAQIRNANRALNLAHARSATAKKRAQTKQRAMDGGSSPKKDERFQALLTASGYLEALPVSEEGLAKVDFVVDEDMARTIAARKARRP